MTPFSVDAELTLQKGIQRRHPNKSSDLSPTWFTPWVHHDELRSGSGAPAIGGTGGELFIIAACDSSRATDGMWHLRIREEPNPPIFVNQGNTQRFRAQKGLHVPTKGKLGLGSTGALENTEEANK